MRATCRGKFNFSAAPPGTRSDTLAGDPPPGTHHVHPPDEPPEPQEPACGGAHEKAATSRFRNRRVRLRHGRRAQTSTQATGICPSSARKLQPRETWKNARLLSRKTAGGANPVMGRYPTTPSTPPVAANLKEPGGNPRVNTVQGSESLSFITVRGFTGVEIESPESSVVDCRKNCSISSQGTQEEREWDVWKSRARFGIR